MPLEFLLSGRKRDLPFSLNVLNMQGNPGVRHHPRHYRIRSPAKEVFIPPVTVELDRCGYRDIHLQLSGSRPTPTNGCSGEKRPFGIDTEDMPPTLVGACPSHP